MNYKDLAQLYDSLDQTTKRLKKTFLLAKFIKQIPNSELNSILLLVQGKVFPDWESKKIGIAGKLVVKAISKSTGNSEKEVISLFKKYGDLGEVANQLCKNKKQQTLFSKSLTVKDVFDTLQKLATHQGIGSQDVKLSNIHKLLGSASDIEAKFIVRTILEDLRIGISTGTIKDAIAYAYYTESLEYDEEKNILIHKMKPGFNLERQKDLVKRALDFTADLTSVLTHIRLGKSLENISLILGKPCKAMLARKEKTFEEATKRTGLPCKVEYKYDGFRVQIHKKDNLVKLFTRSLEDVTKQFPEVVAYIRTHVKSKHCILDGELVGFDSKTHKYMPFQHISQRIRRKYDIKELSEKLPVEAVIFDVLLNKDELIIDLPLTKRLNILKDILRPEAKKIIFVEGEIVNSIEQAQELYDKSLKAGNEGIMLKDLDGKYTPGGRVTAWIKFKPVMEELDLVIVGAEWGEGKRSSWLTSFVLACQNDDGEFLEIGKVGTGFKEKGEGVTFEELTKLLEPLIISEKGKEIRVKPEVIIEVQYEEIQKSIFYSSGFALRFPRVTRLRPDKEIDGVASVEDVKDYYYGQ